MNRLFLTGLLAALLAALVFWGCDFTVHFDEKAAPEFFCTWEDYIDDNVPWRDIIRPGAHNAGAVDCRLFGVSPIQKLDCQGVGIYEQLTFGVRYLDIRVGKNPDFYIVHGLGVSRISLAEALSDIAAFHALYPDEIIEIDVIGYPASYIEFDAEDDKKIADILEGCLPRSLVFSEEFDINTATLAEMRASGRRYIVSSDWYPGAALLDYTGTHSKVYHSSQGVSLAEAEKLYGYFRGRLQDAGPKERLVFATNRAKDGENVPFALPFDYMLNDRPVLDEFFDWVAASAPLLAKVHGFDGDFVSYDTYFCGRTIMLNLVRGSVKNGREAEFEQAIRAAMQR